MLKTLYAKLALGLVTLFVAIGLLYALISSSTTRHYLQEVNQQFNRDLAHNLVADRNLVEEGRLNEEALKATFQAYMVINPSIEIYLLDLDGKILSYSADPGKVKRNHVSLEPIKAFLGGNAEYPLLGEDPRSHDRLKAFSVTLVPSADNPQGYLYVVLRGEEFDSVDRMVSESFFLQLSGWSVVVSLGLGLLFGLVIFHLLTRRLHRLSGLMGDFHRSNFTLHSPYTESGHAASDEVDRLGITFDRMAERIRLQLDQLKEQDSQRRRLVAQVSHDLRTPLASLQGYLESLSLKADSLDPREREEYVAIALRQSRRLSNQVAELFELASLEARETQPRCEPFPIDELIQDVAQKYRLRAEQRQIRMQVQVDGDSQRVYADIALTERVLENLIENAFTHTPQNGEILLTVQGDGHQVRVAVEDSGKGIPEEEIPSLFEPFFRSKTADDSGQHAGLGLAIAKRIIMLQRGQIGAANSDRGGARFTFSLPVDGGLAAQAHPAPGL